MDCVAKTPKEARTLGLKSYFTGFPCKRGEVAFRRLNGDCLCEKCVEVSKQAKAKWAKANRAKLNEWRDANQDKMAVYKADWKNRNKEKARQNILKWKQNNSEKVLAYTEQRRARKLKSLPAWYSDFDAFVMTEAVALSRLRSRVTPVKWSVDHMIPLQAKEASGLHCADNIQVIPSSLNSAKSNRMEFTHPREWIKGI